MISYVINSYVRCPWIVPQCGISWWRVLRWDQWVSHGLTLWCEDSIGFQIGFHGIPMDFPWNFLCPFSGRNLKKGKGKRWKFSRTCKNVMACVFWKSGPRNVSGMTTSSIRINPENVAKVAIAHQLKTAWNAGAECHQGNTWTADILRVVLLLLQAQADGNCCWFPWKWIKWM